jgi:tRNA pseudouridine13 synthase
MQNEPTSDDAEPREQSARPLSQREKDMLERLAAVPFVSGHVPPVEGKLRSEPEDFVVEELPAYLPSGQGEHLYVWFEKRGLNTRDAVRAIARAIGADENDAGYAGLKDRQAVTRQWASFHLAQDPDLTALELEGVRVLSGSRHGNKLRTGHLAGNRFSLRLRDVPLGQEAQVHEVFAHLGRVGLPNYYGSQRFGHGGRNLSSALRWLGEGGRPPGKPFLRKLFVSTLQSALFNLWLAERVADGLLDRAVLGDLMRKEETGGMFLSEDADLDGARVTSWEISPTGPMFGAKMRAPAHEALAREHRVLLAADITQDTFERARKYGEGTRRPARVRCREATVTRQKQDLIVVFELPKGSYATSLMAEVLKSRAIDLSDEP